MVEGFVYRILYVVYRVLVPRNLERIRLRVLIEREGILKIDIGWRGTREMLIPKFE